MREATFPIAFVIGPTKNIALWPVIIIKSVDGKLKGYDLVISFLGGEIGFMYIQEGI